MKWKFYFLLPSVFLYPLFSAAAIDLSVNEILHYEYSKDGTEVNVWTKGAAIQEDRTILSPSREQISANTYAIYPGAKFYQEAGTWYGIERYTEDAETFIAPASSFLGIKKAHADLSPSGINGYTRGSSANYSTAGSTGTATNASAFEAENLISGGTYYRGRRAFGFDATGLTVASSTFMFQVGSLKQNADTDSVSLVVLTPNNYNALIDADHSAFGTTKIASDIAIANLPGTGSWVGMPVTDITSFTGQFALGVRTAKDISNTAPAGLTRVTIANAYLLVETSSPTPTPGTSTATTTAADYERLSAFALTGAVSLLFFLVGFGLTVFIYKML